MPPNLRKMSLNNRDYSFKNLKFKRFLHFINNKNKDVIGENHTSTRKFDSENERIINRGFTALFDPNIETEDIKANVLHSVTKKVWGGNFSSPIENRLIKGVRVLDVCCGPGYWVLDMAKTYPKSTFIGMDISPTFSEREKMTNVAFLECNVHDGLPWPNDTFDFVYQRYAWASYNEVQWKNIISEITRVCKPGGMIELMEFDWEFKNNSPIAMNYQKLLSTYFFSNGLNPAISSKIPLFLKQTDELTDIRSESRDLSLGSWDGLNGMMHLKYHYSSVNQFANHLSKDTNLSDEEHKLKIIKYLKESENCKTLATNRRFFAIKTTHKKNRHTLDNNAAINVY